MAVTSMVLGIISLLISFIPGLNLFIIIPAILGIIFGCIGISKSKTTGNGKSSSITGLVLSIIALIIIILYTLLMGTLIGKAFNLVFENADKVMDEIEEQVGSYIQDIELDEICGGENLEIKFLSINYDYTDYDSFYTVQEGYSVLALEVEIKNKSDNNQSITSYSFECSADFVPCIRLFNVNESALSQIIKPNEKITLELFYIVPNDANSVQVTGTIDDKYIIFEVR